MHQQKASQVDSSNKLDKWQFTSDLTKNDWEQGQDEQQATVCPSTDTTNNKIEIKENILLTYMAV